MTYEMAGSGTAGLAIRRNDGTILTLEDRALRHRVAGGATLRTAAGGKTDLLLGFAEYHRTVDRGQTDIVLVPGAGSGRVEALVQLAFLDESTARSEVTRYLGWPAQAISYAVGQREIVALREARRAREGDAFDLKRFHADVLASGAVGLDHLRELVLR
jgi:hypothetical protein